MMPDYTLLRPELTMLPSHMKRLPIDERGYVVPWFVQWIDGKPEFRLMDPDRLLQAIAQELCWVCGGRLGARRTFVAGPMCCISRTVSEPPSHHDCALWSVMNCPFMTKPRMVRREGGLPEEKVTSSGIMIARNPGVMVLWTARTFEAFSPAPGELLITMGAPLSVEWFREGRPATREECEESIRTGMPALEAIAQHDPRELAALQKATLAIARLLPEVE
jgi:hypothetical protein